MRLEQLLFFNSLWRPMRLCPFDWDDSNITLSWIHTLYQWKMVLLIRSRSVRSHRVNGSTSSLS